GEAPTVSDADLSGGVLGPSLLGGRLPLRADLAAKGIARLGGELHLSPEETVLGVQRVVRATMAKAMRIVLARRGLDPRDFALLAFGGAGPMHAWALARELRIPRVLVPVLPGAFSAYGILISPVQLEYSRTIVRPLDRAPAAIAEAVRAFRSRALKALREEHHDAGYAGSLPAGFDEEGPAIVAEDHATTVVPPGANFRIQKRGLIEIEVAP